MVGNSAVVHDHELKPVVRNFNQRAGDRGVAGSLDGLAVCEELIPGVVGARNLNAAVSQDCLVDEHVLPVTGRRNGVLLAVSGNSHHAGLHVGCEVGILSADLIDGDDFACGDEGLSVGIGEEEQDVGLGAGLEVGEDFCFPLFVGGGGAVVHLVAGGLFISLDSGFEVCAVAVVAAVGGDNIQRNGVSHCDGAQTEQHHGSQKKCQCFFHCFLLL